MAYAVLSDLLAQVGADELAQLCDDTGQGLLDEDPEHTPEQAATATAARAVAERAIADASAEMDGYCGVWKPVPLTEPPAFATRITVDLAVYALYTRRNLSGMSEGRQARYDAAQKVLVNISKGLISLGAAPHAPINQPSSVQGRKVRADRIFTADTLRDF